MTQDPAAIAASIDWTPTCRPGEERQAIVEQVLRAAAPAASGDTIERATRIIWSDQVDHLAPAEIAHHLAVVGLLVDGRDRARIEKALAIASKLKHAVAEEIRTALTSTEEQQ